MNPRMLEQTQNLWNKEYHWCTPSPSQGIQNLNLNNCTKTQPIARTDPESVKQWIVQLRSVWKTCRESWNSWRHSGKYTSFKDIPETLKAVYVSLYAFKDIWFTQRILKDIWLKVLWVKMGFPDAWMPAIESRLTKAPACYRRPRFVNNNNDQWGKSSPLPSASSPTSLCIYIYYYSCILNYANNIYHFFIIVYPFKSPFHMESILDLVKISHKVLWSPMESIGVLWSPLESIGVY